MLSRRFPSVPPQIHTKLSHFSSNSPLPTHDMQLFLVMLAATSGCLLESQNPLGWKRSLRSSPTTSLKLPSSTNPCDQFMFSNSSHLPSQSNLRPGMSQQPSHIFPNLLVTYSCYGRSLKKCCVSYSPPTAFKAGVVSIPVVSSI